MGNRYLDQLMQAYYDSSMLKKISFGLIGVIAIQAIAIVALTSKLLGNLERTRYILSPGIAVGL